ncbi:amidohydrolase family protein [Sphingosinicella sp.]|uniref:amidohydrolase family protein n=1 Tax=Sphingosinicella sp. TaxID=1917971 RepID=UPI0035AFB44B
MTTKRILRYVSLLSIVVATTGSGPAEQDMSYDLVILHGRVIDPESGLDAERNVAIHNGSIVAVTTAAIKGKRSIDGTGLVVAPGFIDIHSHAQQLPGARMQAFDGVTTALELELGMLPIDRYYEETAHEGRPINFGASASWVQARQAVMDGAKLVPSIKAFQDAAHLPNWSSRIASEKEISSMSALMEEAIGQGALGIGFNVGYSPPSGRREYYMLNKLAAAHNVPTFTHVRFASTEEPHSSFEAYEEMVAVAASTGAHMHISHFNSTALRDVPKIVELVRGAQERAVPLTVEAYPYSAASTVVGAAMFRGPDWQKRLGGVRYEDFEHAGKRLDEASFKHLQSTDPGAIIVYKYLRPDNSADDQRMLDLAVLYPGGAVASDAMPWMVDGRIVSGDIWPMPENAFSHPRSAGTFSRFIREYSRERKLVSLPEAIRRITLVPARILEPSVPQMVRKGRIRPGADADVIVFDPNVISDKATFAAPAQPSIGMRWVIVAGTPVIIDGQLDRSAMPGRPVRRPIEIRP